MAKTKAGPISADRLKSLIERIEKLEEERKAIGGDIRDVYSEAKGVGYDVKTMRKVVQLRRMDAADRDEQEALLEVYLHALGMVDRIEARAAAGESAREIAEAEGISKSTAHRVSQKARAKNESAEMGHDPETGEINPEDGAAETAKPEGPAAPTEGTPSTAGPEQGAADRSWPLNDALQADRTGEPAALSTAAAGAAGDEIGDATPQGRVDGDGSGSTPSDPVVPPVFPSQAGGAEHANRQAGPNGGDKAGTIEEAAPPTLFQRITGAFSPAPADDAARLHAQIPTSTDPDRLEREAVLAESAARLCGCERCVESRAVALRAGGHSLNVTLLGPGAPGWRYACETCGNKRCPHHTDHALACTGSNEPGQPGSSWESYPPPVAPSAAAQDQPVDLKDPVALDVLRISNPEKFLAATAQLGDAGDIPAFLRRQSDQVSG